MRIRESERRDPFVSLMNTEELRPLLGDLKLVAIALDPTGRNSVAVLRDMSTKEQYRVKVGQEIGRMRVAAIHAEGRGVWHRGVRLQPAGNAGDGDGFNQSEDAMRQFLAACAALALIPAAGSLQAAAISAGSSAAGP